MRHFRISVAIAHRALRFTLTMAVLGATAGSHAATDPKASKYFEDALGRYEKKDIPGAIIQLKNALQIDPTMLPVQVLLGKALLQSGDAVAAEVALLEALKLGVNRAEVVIQLSRAFIVQGKQKQFVEQAQFAPAGLPPDVRLDLLLLRSTAFTRNVNVWLAEVPVRIRGRQFKEAMLAADKALALSPSAAEAWYQKGSIFHVSGDVKAALAAYDKVLQMEPAHIEARVARAGIYIDLDQLADASRDIVEIQRLSAGEPRAAYLKSIVAQRNKSPGEARAALNQVTR
jgi:tetratricopeptide (TPR) repeat protein